MSAWDVFWLLFVFVPLTIIWVMVLLDLMRRPDLVGWQKAAWVAGVIFFPWIGVLAYLITRPSDAALGARMGAYGSGASQAAPTATSPAPARRGPPTPVSTVAPATSS